MGGSPKSRGFGQCCKAENLGEVSLDVASSNACKESESSMVRMIDMYR